MRPVLRPAPACTLALTVLAAACGPVPVEQAEANCLQRAELARRPQGTLGFGIGSGGARFAGVGIDISSDYLMGRDPAQVYAACVQAQSGQPPRVPLYDRPDWKG